MPAVHPEPARLSDFVRGKLEPAAIDAIEEHLSACGLCCDTLKQLQGDTFADLVKQAGREHQPDVAATLSLATSPTAEAGPVGIPAELAEHPRYRVVELLGTGGMGAVFLAEHRLMQRMVALKTINPRLVASESAVERFRREVRAAAKLHHPNIVTSHDADQAGDLHFFVMEHVAGKDLAQIVEERGPLPVAEACEYVRQAALGLQHAHEHGMTHRDIKPHNLMVVPGPVPQVKILDFGLASLAAEAAVPSESNDAPAPGLTGAGALMGTPDYMAPEQARDARSADIRADVYSLGCTLYTLLTGKVPFPGGTALDKVEAHVKLAPKPLAAVRPDLPPGLVRVIDRMMAKDPARRYQTPAEVAAALSPVVTAARPRRSRMRLAMAACGVAALLVLGSIVYVKTNRGDLKIESAVDDVQVVVSREGTEVEVIDLKSGTTVKRLPTGSYDVKLKGDRTDVTVEGGGFTMKRGGQEVVRVKQVAADTTPKPRRKLSPTDAITPAQRAAVAKGLAYLVKTQHPEGFWEAAGGNYRTALTALAGMTLLMEGSTVDAGPYAPALRKAVDWLTAQAQPSGLLANPADKSEAMRYMFGHGYSMLFLSSVYALEPDGERRQKLQTIITKAVEFTAAATTKRGGWGYVTAKEGNDFDESCTTIVQLQGLRAARNAGINVPRKVLDVDLLRKSTGKNGGVVYSQTNPDQSERPPLTAAALSAAEFDTALTKKWLLYCRKMLPLDGKPRGFDAFTDYYYAQAVYLLGETGYARIVPDSPPADRLTWSGYKKARFATILRSQAADGTWPDAMIGPLYGTICNLTILQLDNAAVPIYQR